MKKDIFREIRGNEARTAPQSQRLQFLPFMDERDSVGRLKGIVRKQAQSCSAEKIYKKCHVKLQNKNFSKGSSKIKLNAFKLDPMRNLKSFVYCQSLNPDNKKCRPPHSQKKVVLCLQEKQGNGISLYDCRNYQKFRYKKSVSVLILSQNKLRLPRSSNDSLPALRVKPAPYSSPRISKINKRERERDLYDKSTFEEYLKDHYKRKETAERLNYRLFTGVEQDLRLMGQRLNTIKNNYEQSKNDAIARKLG